MVDIVCPKCGLKDCYIIGTEGEIKEERFFETHECLSCGEVFEVKDFHLVRLVGDTTCRIEKQYALGEHEATT